MKFFITIKQKSIRLKNKNFVTLGGVPLWKHLLLELKGQNVFIDTDSSTIIKECSHMDWVCAYERDQYHIDIEEDTRSECGPGLMMIERFLDEHVLDENEVIIQSHTTSPFIKLETMLDAANKLQNGYDSVLACTTIQGFAYYQTKPVNFNPKILKKTQDLEPILLGNGAFYIFTKKTFKKHNNRTGNPYFYSLSFKEGIEIDTIDDYELAKRYV